MRVRLALAIVGVGFALGCGVPAPSSTAVGGAGDIAHYTCPMHASVRAGEPSSCPLCGMPLEAVGREALANGEVRLDPQRLPVLGIATVAVALQPVTIAIRALGRVTWDRGRLTDINLRYQGWIGELVVDRPGQKVESGQTLFTLYSPDLQIAQRQYLGALEMQQRSNPGPRTTEQVIEARRYLERWGLSTAAIDALARRKLAADYVPIAAPAAGYVTEMHAVAGSSVQPGTTIYRLARLDRVWIEADVYLEDRPLIALGLAATVSDPTQPERRWTGKIDLVYPFVDQANASRRIRIELDNADLALLPGSRVEVTVLVERGERPLVPEAAVVFTGARRVVFVAIGETRFRPRTIEIGHRTGNYFELLSGLELGERIVSPASFLVAAESRLANPTD